ncbi:MAG: hypothetical protein HY741_16220 [Chloroflexi bacterium]|nr:hypothetical protein [Chloroflexota bacterium]
MARFGIGGSPQMLGGSWTAVGRRAVQLRFNKLWSITSFGSNDFDGLMTFTVLNQEYKLDGHTQQWVQVPGGQEFTASVSVVGVGKTNFGPVSLQAGECVRYQPRAG